MVVSALVPTVISILTPLATKGAKALAEAAGKAAAEQATSLMDTLKAKWSNDSEATGTLKRFESNPERYEPMLEDILSEKIGQDPVLEAELEKLLAEMGDNLLVVQKLGRVSGEAVGLEAKELARGRNVTVEQSADEVSGKITGAKIDRLG